MDDLTCRAGCAVVVVMEEVLAGSAAGVGEDETRPLSLTSPSGLSLLFCEKRFLIFERRFICSKSGFDATLSRLTRRTRDKFRDTLPREKFHGLR